MDRSFIQKYLHSFDYKKVLDFINIYKKLRLHVRGAEVIFPIHVTDAEIEKVIDGIGFGMGLTDFKRTSEFKDLGKKYRFPKSDEIMGDKSFDLEFIKTEHGEEKKVLIYVRSYEKEKTGEFTAESLLQTVISNLQEGFIADIKSIRRLEKNDLPLLKWYQYLFIIVSTLFFPLLAIVILIAVFPFFLGLFTFVTGLLTKAQS